MTQQSPSLDSPLMPSPQKVMSKAKIFSKASQTLACNRVYLRECPLPIYSATFLTAAPLRYAWGCIVAWTVLSFSAATEEMRAEESCLGMGKGTE